MRMDGQDESSNVEDVRGMRGGRGGGGIGFGGRSVGIGGVVVAVIAGWIFGINPLTLLGLIDGAAPVEQTAPQGQRPQPPQNDAQAQFVSQVLRSTEVVWTDVFREAGRTYRPPKLVLYRGSWPTACGTGDAAMGPFYCPGDEKVYIDLDFFDVMRKKLGAPGDFAQAYVIAHEVGHHVQAQLGIMERVDGYRQRSSPAQSNALSVRVELQADCFAGLWARRSQQAQGWRLEPGDIEEALNAASQIGDDALQGSRRGGAIVPESFTHGSSAQRVSWFRRGIDSGTLGQCDTFDTRQSTKPAIAPPRG